jgi:hypothetical protein
LTKEVPFAGCSRQEIAAAKRSARLPGAMPDSLSPEFCSLVARCLHVNPLLRPSFLQLYSCFQQLVEQIDAAALLEQQQQQLQQQQQQQLLDNTTEIR